MLLPMTTDTRQPSRGRTRAYVPIAAAGILIALSMGVVAYWHFFLQHPPVGTGPAGPAVAREAFQSPWTTRPTLLLGLGDSVTAGYGASPGLSYFERLAANPPGEFSDMDGLCLKAVLPRLQTQNASVSGSTSIDCLERQIPPLTCQDPDVYGLVVITTGGNDLIHFYGRTPPQEGAMYGATLEQAKPWIAHFETRLDQIVEAVTDLFPGGCRIFLANVYDPSDGVGDTKNAGLPPWPEMLAVHGAYNDVIARCAKKHPEVRLVDIHQTFLGHGIHCAQPWQAHYDSKDPHYWYYDNLEDPNDRGYDALRRVFLLDMAQSVRETPIPALESVAAH